MTLLNILMEMRVREVTGAEVRAGVGPGPDKSVGIKVQDGTVTREVEAAATGAEETSAEAPEDSNRMEN